MTTPITRWELAYKKDLLRKPGRKFDDVVAHESRSRDTFDSLAKAVEDARQRLWESVSCGDGPKDDDQLVLRITNATTPPTMMYYNVTFVEIHSFELDVEDEGSTLCPTQ